MEKRPTIAILIGFAPNPRIYKRIALEKSMADLHLIFWDRGYGIPYPAEGDGYTSYALKIHAGTDPVRRLFPYSKFIRKSMALLKQIHPDLIHVQGLDMLKIASAYKQKYNRNVRIVYEVADLHRFLVDKQKSPVKKLVQRYLRREDRRLKDRYDLLILTSPKYYEVYFNTIVEPERMLYMPNVPDLSGFSSYEKKSADEPFTVGYIGAIRYKKQIANLIEAAKQTGVRLLVAGYEDEPVEIEPMCQEDPNITWVGRFDFAAQAASLYGKCDAIYAVYDADMHNVRVALPNKLYESIYCELPLIVAKGTYLAETVDQWGVGLAVDHREPQELIALLEQLRDRKIPVDSISANCRQRKADIDLALHNQKLKAWLNRILALSE